MRIMLESTLTEKIQLVTLCSYILEHSGLMFPLRSCKYCSWVCSRRHRKAKKQSRNKIKKYRFSSDLKCFGCMVTFKRMYFSAFVIARNRLKILSWKVKTYLVIPYSSKSAVVTTPSITLHQCSSCLAGSFSTLTHQKFSLFLLVQSVCFL